LTNSEVGLLQSFNCAGKIDKSSTVMRSKRDQFRAPEISDTVAKLHTRTPQI